MYFISKKKMLFQNMKNHHYKTIEQGRLDKYIIRGLVDTLKTNYLKKKNKC